MMFPTRFRRPFSGRGAGEDGQNSLCLGRFAPTVSWGYLLASIRGLGPEFGDFWQHFGEFSNILAIFGS